MRLNKTQKIKLLNLIEDRMFRLKENQSTYPESFDQDGADEYTALYELMQKFMCEIYGRTDVEGWPRTLRVIEEV